MVNISRIISPFANLGEPTRRVVKEAPSSGALRVGEKGSLKFKSSSRENGMGTACFPQPPRRAGVRRRRIALARHRGGNFDQF